MTVDSSRTTVLSVTLLCCVALPAAAQEGVEIALVHRAPPSVVAGETVTVEGNMLGASEVESAELFYRTSRTAGWRNLEMELVTGDHYRVEIPAGDVREPTLEYYVVAVDFLETRYDAFASAAKPAEVTVTAAAASDPEPQPTPRPFDTHLPAQHDPPTEPPPEPEPPRVAADNGLLGEPGSITVIDGDAIEAMGARTLTDVLELAPEVDISRSVDGFTRVAVRGQRADGDVLVLIDGHAMNNVYDGRAFFDLPADIIDRVEIRRGPAVALRTHGALAGSINVITRTDVRRRFAAAVGSHLSHLTDDDAKRYGSYLLAARGGVASESLRFSAFADLEITDGTQATVADDAFVAGASSSVPGPADDGAMRVAGGGVLQLDGLVPGAMTVSTTYLYENRGASVGFLDAYGPNSKLSWHVGMAQLTHELPLNEMATLHYRVGIDLQKTDRTYQLTPAGFELSDRDGDGLTEVFADGVSEQLAVSTLGGVAEIGADLALAETNELHLFGSVAHHRAGDAVLRRNIDDAGAAVPTREVDNSPLAGENLARTTVALSVEDDWTPADVVTVRIGFSVAWLSDVGKVEIDKTLSPRLIVDYRPFEPIAFELLYGSGFRPPTFAERTDQRATSMPAALREDRFVGNPRLDHAARHTLEGAVRYADILGGIGYRARAAGFYSRMVDTIGAVAGAADQDATSQLTRISQRSAVDQVGVDLEGRATFASRSYVFIGGWWHRTLDRQPDLGDATLMTAVPQVGGVFGLQLELGALADLHLSARYGAERRNPRRTAVERLRTYSIPATTVVNVALRSVPLANRFRIGLNVHNLFDTARVDDVPRPDLLPGMAPREGLQILFTAEVVD